MAKTIPDQGADHLPAQAIAHIPEALLPPPLVVAFTDTNGDHIYQAGTDLLIASLLDTNRDGVASAGDTIQWGTYPTSLFDGLTPRGNFINPDTLVTGVVAQDSTPPGTDGFFSVSTDHGLVFWESSIGAGGHQAFGAQTSPPNLFLELYLLDNSIQLDLIYADPSVNGPAHPDTSQNLIDFAAIGNQGFVDLTFYT
jgi:hypothetical protein